MVPGASPCVEICRSPPGSYGLWTSVTCSSCRTSAKSASIGSRTAGSRTSSSAWNTMVPNCGDAGPSGSSASRRSKPSVDSKPLSVKSCRYASPTPLAMTLKTTSAAIHTNKTTLRRSWHHGPSRANMSHLWVDRRRRSSGRMIGTHYAASPATKTCCKRPSTRRTPPCCVDDQCGQRLADDSRRVAPVMLARRVRIRGAHPPGWPSRVGSPRAPVDRTTSGRGRMRGGRRN